MANAFVIKDIAVEGNKRISFETIRSYLPVEKGDVLTPELAAKSLKQLYKTKFFKDISLYKLEDGTLKIVFLERPSIADISIEGNELIKTEDLKTALASMGVKKGRIFNESSLEKIVVDLRRQYQNQGYYAAEVDIVVKKLPRNRVSLVVKVEEGKPASIGRITLVGNKVYSDDHLKGRMLLSETSLMGGGDKYAKPKLQSDQETIKSYYMDRGFAEFKLKSSQVSLALDKTQVFITINFKEGPQYEVSNIRFSGETGLDKAELDKLLRIHKNELFSRGKIIATVNAIRDRLSEEGYAFAKIEPITKLDKDNHLVSIDFRIELKKRVYVRRVIIRGNTRTHDNVIRRELRQLESAPYSLKAVRRSNSRLNRLGYFKVAKIETNRLSADQVDLVVNVEEQSTGSFNAGLGFSQLDGLSLTLGVTERNVIGSGYKANLNGTFSKSTKTLDLGLTNPFFTSDGVSLGGGLYYREVDAKQLRVANYTTNNYGVRLSMGYPTSEYSNLNYGLRFDDQNLICDQGFTVCTDYTAKEGSHFNSVKPTLGWSYDTKNSFYFPTSGQSTSLSAEVTVPTSSKIYYYKLFAKESVYFPMTKNLTLKIKADLGYGAGFNDSVGIPFYEHFYAGGIGSVRGYEPNSLGPVYNYATDGSSSAAGGSVRVVTNAEIIFPMPFIDDSGNLRLSLFVDAGNVFDGFKNVKAKDVRASTGLGVAWITPVGPLAFSLAYPLNAQKTDKTQVFQFNLGIPL